MAQGKGMEDGTTFDLAAHQRADGLGHRLLCRPGAGLLLVLTVLASLPWLSMRAWECLNDSSRRKTLWPSIAMTLLALAVPSAVHFQMATDARRHAQRLIDAVELHH